MTETEVRVVDVDAEIGETEREPLGEGEVGVVLARGKQIMKVRDTTRIRISLSETITLILIPSSHSCKG